MKVSPLVLGSILGLTLAISGPALAAHHRSTEAESSTSEAPPTGGTVRVAVGSQKVLRAVSLIKRVAIGAPSVADVVAINSRELLVMGKGLGSTSLVIWPTGGGAPTEYQVRVDPTGGQDEGMSSLKISEGGISGTTTSLIAHRRAEFAAGSSPGKSESGPGGGSDEEASGTVKIKDASEVLLDSQVMSQIKVVEVNRTTLQEYGFNFFKNTGSVTAGLAAPSTISGIQTSDATGNLAITSSNGFLPVQSAFNLLLGSAKNGIFGALSVLEDKGLARTLAEPSLTATSGQTATFLAGGEFPVPVPQASSGSTPTITIQYKEYGVRLNLTPTVLANNRIALRVAPEVSELDYTNAVSIDGFTIPGLITRRTDTFIELGDGESFVISGLVSNTIKNNVDKVPFLGDLPIIGAFFRDTSMSRADKELIMIVTPHLVHPLRRDDQLPPLPGESVQKYNPSFAQTMFLESGSFGQTEQSGYSR